MTYNNLVSPADVSVGEWSGIRIFEDISGSGKYEIMFYVDLSDDS